MVRYCLTVINQVFCIQIPRNVRFAEDHGPATVVGGKLSLLPLILIHSFLPQHRSPLCVHYSHLYDFVVNCIGEQICSKKKALFSFYRINWFSSSVQLHKHLPGTGEEMENEWWGNG